MYQKTPSLQLPLQTISLHKIMQINQQRFTHKYQCVRTAVFILQRSKCSKNLSFSIILALSFQAIVLALTSLLINRNVNQITI